MSKTQTAILQRKLTMREKAVSVVAALAMVGTMSAVSANASQAYADDAAGTAEYAAQIALNDAAATDIAEAGIQDCGGQYYTGKDVKPYSPSTHTRDATGALSIWLTEGVDYTVEYSDTIGSATEQTTATATITGIGNYTGTVTFSYKIYPSYSFEATVGEDTITLTKDQLLAYAKTDAYNTKDAMYIASAKGGTTVFAAQAKQYLSLKTLLDELGYSPAGVDSIVFAANDGFKTSTISGKVLEEGYFWPEAADGNVVSDGKTLVPAALAFVWGSASLSSAENAYKVGENIINNSPDAVVVRDFVGCIDDTINAGKAYGTNVTSMNVTLTEAYIAAKPDVDAVNAQIAALPDPEDIVAADAGEIAAASAAAAALPEDEQIYLSEKMMTKLSNDIAELENHREKVYRLYNSDTNEHLYTTDENENSYLSTHGWTAEGVCWVSPTEGTAVYRLYNKKMNQHLFTDDPVELKSLMDSGEWNIENNEEPIFYSADEGTTDVFRLYQEKDMIHLLTTDQNEIEYLTTVQGWVYDNDDAAGNHRPYLYAL